MYDQLGVVLKGISGLLVILLIFTLVGRSAPLNIGVLPMAALSHTQRACENLSESIRSLPSRSCVE